MTDVEIRDAEERGRRRQEVDGRLNGQEQRLNAINGSVERSAKAQEGMRTELAQVKQAVAGLAAKLETSEAVQTAVARAAVSRREFWLGVAAVVAVLAGALISGGAHP